MSESGGGAGGGLVATVSAGIAAAKQMWEVFILPAGAIGFGAVKYFGTRRDKRDADRRSEEQRRDDAWSAKLARADQQVQAHVTWQEGRALHAEARAKEAEAELDALREKMERNVADLREERWRAGVALKVHRDALADARSAINALERKLGQEPTAWRPLDEPPT